MGELLNKQHEMNTVCKCLHILGKLSLICFFFLLFCTKSSWTDSTAPQSQRHGRSYECF